jgi:3-hydroxyisobutyrate dehydrogenase
VNRVGFVGLGNMGAALAHRLVGTTSLVVFDLNSDRVRQLTKAGAEAASSLAALGSEVTTVITCLPTSGHVREVLLGDDGIASTLPPGSLVVDCTTGDPKETKEMAATLGKRDITLVDSPVSGGPQAAALGTIAIIVGASDADFERVAPLLGLISPNIRHAGNVGAGHCVKLLNNILAAGHRMLAFETAEIAAANDVDPKTFIEVVNLASGRSYATEITMLRHVFGENLDQGFTVGLMTKDVALGCRLLPDGLQDISLALQVGQRMQAALEALGPDTDINRTIQLYERGGGVRVATSERPGESTPPYTLPNA